MTFWETRRPKEADKKICKHLQNTDGGEFEVMSVSYEDSSYSAFTPRYEVSSTDSSCFESVTALAEEATSVEVKIPEETSETKNCVTPLYNGRALNISSELVSAALSGISLKHYYGKCLPPKEDDISYSEEGEYYFDVGDLATEEELKESLTKLCFIPKKQNLENVPEEISDFAMPECVQEKINHRNTFWDLHRPELSKLTWPYNYVSEATVTEHLHKHFIRHGSICSPFHDPTDMEMMYRRELDEYGRLKELQSPREIPPDEKPDEKNVGRDKQNPCKPKATDGINWKDDSDLDLQLPVHASKEEFCITIGRPVRKPPLRETEDTEGGQFLLTCPDGEYEVETEYCSSDLWNIPECKQSYADEGEMEGYLKGASESGSDPVWVDRD